MAKGHIYYWRYDTRAGPIRYWEMPLFHIILAHRNTTFERLPLAIAITNTSLTVSLYTHTYHGYFYLVYHDPSLLQGSKHTNESLLQ
jgi:hypothetical protein